MDLSELEIDWDSSFDSISASPAKSCPADVHVQKPITSSSFRKQLFSNAPCPAVSETAADPKAIFVDAQKRYFVQELADVDKISTRYSLKSEGEDGHEAWLQMYDLWHHELKLEPNVLINVVDVEMDDERTYRVSKGKGFVIVNPDQLLSITSVMNQMWCERKSALTDVFKTAAQSEDALRGTIAHDLLGRAMDERLSDKENLKTLIFQCINSPSIMQAAYACRMTMKELLAMAEELLPYVQDFVDTKFLKKPRDQKFKILEVCDIEDTYWNPVFGFKGKLDATVKIKYDSGEEKIVPFEFKTGNAMYTGKSMVRAEHTGQVSLYTLLIRPRYGHVDTGLLLYIREKFLKECKVSMLELQYLVCMKNKLAMSLTTENGLVRFPRPGNIDYERKCTRCEYRNVCSALLRGTCPSSPKKGSSEQKIVESSSHLTTEDVNFFFHWFRVITLEVEAHQTSPDCTPLWKCDIPTRERKGLCLSGLKLQSISSSEVIDANGNRCFQLTLTRDNFRKAKQRSIILEKDMVIVGTQYELCISYGYIESISDQYVVLTIERKLNAKSAQPDTVFTLDKISGTSALQYQYSYLSKLMDATPEAKRIRDLVIRKKPPKLTKDKTTSLSPAIRKIVSSYNNAQKRVILKSLETDSFLFVKGMPGTGKTETIVGLLRVLKELQQRVLVVAYTNSAVDNILQKYKLYSDDILRIGSITRSFDQDMRAFSSAEIVKNTKNLDQLTLIFNNRQTVASTLLSLKHEIFRQRTFDYCIIDEASQALPTSVFGALTLAKKFIFFGDPDQLPPVIKSQKIKEMKVPECMFTLAAQPVNTVKLVMQYRMNPTIMQLANALVYKDQMMIGSNEQEELYLQLEPKRVAKVLANTDTSAKRWIAPVLSEKQNETIIFVDTSLVNYVEERIGESVKNSQEAAIVSMCVKALVESGVKGEDLGIIAPFRGQVAHIRQIVKDMGNEIASVEVNTVDQYQGRDKDVILCSFTKSKSCNSNVLSDTESKVSILQDLRRLNVAITRAKKKLIMIGNKNTLQNFEPFKLLFQHLEENQFIQLY